MARSFKKLAALFFGISEVDIDVTETVEACLDLDLRFTLADFDIAMGSDVIAAGVEPGDSVLVAEKKYAACLG